jgi:xanthine dehydrogenase YagS FAD-binding subunit
MKDMMASFDLQQPASVEDALGLLERSGKEGWALAGGNDSLSWFKDRVKRPKTVIDLTGIGALRGIRESADGLEIGALTTLSEIEASPLVTGRYGLLAKAAGHVASPQIRNTGTIGGNVAQDTRCWYYRAGMQCYRAGGNTCYADTPTGMNREHTLFEASRCIAVSPSDVAPALVALEARMVIRNRSGTREVPVDDFFIGPAVDITRMTVLEPGDLITAIRLPGRWAGATFYFEKVADRAAWDFPLVNVAAAMKVKDGVIEALRIACGGVEATPRRLQVVEDLATGQKKDADTARLAGTAAVRGARPRNYNHFKVALMQNLVTRAIRDA